MDDTKLVLVTGATGRQGGATARELLARGWRVRVLVRTPDAPAARALQAAGADLVQGDLEDRASLAAALTGAHGVFSLQNFWAKGVGYEGEIRQARNLAEGAARAGIRHFVQSSIASCDQAPAVEHFACKHEIEKLIDALGLPRTFLRTVFFMDNFTDPKTEKMMFPVLAGALRPDLRFHMISTDDVGRFAADAFDDPDAYLGRVVEVAGDALTVGEMKAVYERVMGIAPPRWRMPRWVLGIANRDMGRQLAWNHAPGWTVPVESVRLLRSDVESFETFLLRHRRGATYR